MSLLLTCADCTDLPCVRVCPTRAILPVGPPRTVEILEDLCIGCGCCTTACPFDRLEVDHASCKVLVRDHPPAILG